MVRFGQKSTKMLSTRPSPDGKMRGKVGNCLLQVVLVIVGWEFSRWHDPGAR